MSFYIKLADQVIEINNKYEQVCLMCKDYIISNEMVNHCSFSVEATQKDFDSENAFISQEVIKNDSDGMYSFYNPGNLEPFIIYRKICDKMPLFGTILIHGSVIAVNNVGYMLVAPSGTGKTTRTRLWLERIPGSFVVNGDKPLIRIFKNEIYACGTPWCGKEGWNKNVMVPLRALLLLERSVDEKSSAIDKVELSEVFDEILMHTYKPHNSLALFNTLNILNKFDQKVKIYKFISARSYESIDLAWDAVQ